MNITTFYRKPSILSILSIILLLSGCAGEQHDKKSPSAVIEGTRLRTDALMGREFICISGNSLIMRSFYPDTVAVIYDIAGDSLKRDGSFGIKGRGPFEFTYPSFYLRQDSLYMLDASLSGELPKIVCAAVEDLRNGSGYDKWKEYDLQWIGSMLLGMGFVPAGGQDFILIGEEFGKENLLNAVNISERTVRGMDYWIDDNYSGPVIPKQSIYTGNADIFINGDRLLYASGEGRYLEILRLGKDFKLSHETSIYSIPPVYEATPDGLNFKPLETSYRGIDAYTTDRFIYISLNPYNPEYKPYKGYPWYCADEIEVYDWDGNFAGCFATDIPFYDFVVTPDDGTLYTLTEDPGSGEPAVYKTALPISRPVRDKVPLGL